MLQDSLAPAFFASLLTSTWEGLAAARDAEGKRAASASFQARLAGLRC